MSIVEKSQHLESNHFPNPYFQQIIFFPVPAGFIKTVVRNNLSGEFTPQMIKYQDTLWDQFSGKKWPNDTKSSRYSLYQLTIDPKSQEITFFLDPNLSYKSIKTISQLPFYQRFKNYPLPLAVSTIIRTTESNLAERLVLTKRKIADYKPQGFHVVGGYPEFRPQIDDPTKLDLSQISPEVYEETGLEAFSTTICQRRFLGLVFTRDQPHLEAIFSLKTHLSSQELLQLKHDKENELFTIPNTPHDLEKWITSFSYTGVASGLAALLFHGRHSFQDSYPFWYQQTLDLLSNHNYNRLVKPKNPQPNHTLNLLYQSQLESLDQAIKTQAQS